LIFNFGGASVPSGSNVTFTQVQVDGQGLAGASFEIGNSSPAYPEVFETQGTTPPLSTIIRHTVGLELTQLDSTPPSAPVGGVVEPANKLMVFAPYLALFGVIAVVVVAVAPWKKCES